MKKSRFSWEQIAYALRMADGGTPVVVTTTVDADGNYSLPGVDVSGLVDGELTVTATAQSNTYA